jgi:hypothetical protein
MNNAPAALIDQQPSTIGPKEPSLLQQYNVRWMNPYLSGRHIVDTYPELGPFGFPYYMAGIATLTCEMFRINAPVAQQRSSMTHIVRPISAVGQAPFGQAPTSGIYTGVEGSC